MVRAATLGLLALVSACAPSSDFDYEAAVKRELRDPESAQFSDVAINVESACGFVNSRNGYGGYSGKVPFVVVGRNPATADASLLEHPTDADTGLVDARCIEPARSTINAWITEQTIAKLKAGI